MRITIAGWLLLVMIAPAAFSSDTGDGATADGFTAARAELVHEIEAQVRATKSYLGRDELDPRVIAAMGKVPRHKFVPLYQQFRAYENRPLPIGYEQTISQPYIVAIMTDLLQVFEGGRVLEVGTGSGYQAAVLGELCETVYSIEIVEPLGEQATVLLDQLGYANVHVKIGDGYAGWPEHAPFDGIMLTAAPEQIPAALLDQLAIDARLVAPIGPQGAQRLMCVQRGVDGFEESILDEVSFVPMIQGLQ